MFLLISKFILNSDINFSIDAFRTASDDLFKYNLVNTRYTDSFSKIEKYSDIYRFTFSLSINCSMTFERDSEGIFSSIMYLKNKFI